MKDKVNFITIIEQLRSSGLSEIDIAIHCRTSQPTINRLASGVTTEPRHSVGVRLVELHASTMNKKRRATDKKRVTDIKEL